MNNYTQSSIRERIALDLFKMSRGDFFITRMSHVESKDKWDAEIISGGTPMLLEIKVRDWKHNSHKDWIIEQDKADFLLERAKNKRMQKPFYINVFRDGVAFWDLQEQEIEFFDRVSKKSVMAQNGEKKEKKIGMLLIDNSAFYPMDINFDELNQKTHDAFKVLYPNSKIEKLFRNERR
jgi:hypothetical protein